MQIFIANLVLVPAPKEVINKHEIKDALREKLANFKLSKEELSIYSTLEKTILLKTV